MSTIIAIACVYAVQLHRTTCDNGFLNLRIPMRTTFASNVRAEMTGLTQAADSSDGRYHINTAAPRYHFDGTGTV